MEIHHDKHHATYVNNLNNALQNRPEFSTYSLEQLLSSLESMPEDIRTVVRNNGGGHYNHTLFWELMKPNGGGDPTGEILSKINTVFGDYAKFKEEFTKSALGRFGSGWAWLIKDGAGKLAIMSSPNQDNPVMEGKKPILGLDVWEHAYYLKYQNRRADYVAAWFNVINWEKVNELLAAS